jgi:Trehalase
MKNKLFILYTLISLGAYSQAIEKYSITNLPKTGVQFETQDTLLKKVFDAAETKAIGNIRYLSPQYTAMFEGGPYPFFWIENQPMGGVMYAKRDLNVAANNILLFLNNQRKDGRISGMIADYNYLKNNKLSEGWIRSSMNWNPSKDGFFGLNFGQLQGFYLPEPALELYYLINQDKVYLATLYHSLEAYDNYLWKYRDSDGDGCLETWCMTDNGEDHLERFRYAPWNWPSNNAPKMETMANVSDKSDTGECAVPEESIDVMSYSYSCRNVLAKISKILKNGKESFWRNKADSVSEKMKDYLWLPEKKAYFYRDRKNKIINSLTHNNLRAMYFGTMSQSMADDFIRYHLLNPNEFWTPMPLTSIAANDSFFRSVKNNNWSGQPQGLTYQRSIRALENYGHYAEVCLIGHKLLSKKHLKLYYLPNNLTLLLASKMELIITDQLF